MKISVTILTKDSERYLQEVLDSVRHFDEVLVVDNGSTDRTLELASTYPNVTIRETEFIGFGPLHNLAIEWAKHDWILSLDSDEVVTPELSDELARLELDKNCVYAFPRHNMYNGRHIRWCSWHPDYQVRVFNRMSTRFTDAQVHEGVITRGLKTRKLQHPVRHYSYDSTAEFLDKMQTYSTLWAEQNLHKRKGSVTRAVGHALYAFIKSYFRHRGIFGGKEGLLISVYNANTAFYKYVKLAEMRWNSGGKR